MRGQTLAALLVVVLIIAIVAAFIYLSQTCPIPTTKRSAGSDDLWCCLTAGERG
jgi:Tfp pilus assembly protein PilE